MTIEFIVEGEPVAQPRPKVTTRNGFAHAYVAAKHPIHAYRKAVATTAHGFVVHFKKMPFPKETPVSVQIVFTLSRPKSKPKAQWKTTKPDIENLAKGVLDAMTGILYDDDSQVVSLSCHKTYGDRPSTRIRLYSPDEDPPSELPSVLNFFVGGSGYRCRGKWPELQEDACSPSGLSYF